MPMKSLVKPFSKPSMRGNTIKDPERIVGWLKTTARNAAIDRLRNSQQKVNQIHEAVSLYNVDGGRETAEASMLATQQAQQTETEHYLLRRLLRLLSEKDLQVVEYLLDDLKPKQIAEAIGSTAEAVQKRWERILKWLRPIARNLDTLISDLPPQEQKIVERYLDNQPLKEISEKLGISPHDIETCVKRVIKRWKKTTK